MTAYRYFKSIFDRFLALLVLFVMSPVLGLIAIGVKLDSPGSIIFRQERAGEDGRLFILYKFRSMHENNDDSQFKTFLQKYVQEGISSRLDENGEDIYQLVHDPRVTKFGSLLRKFNLDELPQLINVLKGDMAFIGPRPDIPFTVNMYQPNHRARLKAKPGITGLWQVSGRRSLSFDEMVNLDIEYIERQSPFIDAKIILLTILEVLRREER